MSIQLCHASRILVPMVVVMMVVVSNCTFAVAQDKPPNRVAIPHLRVAADSTNARISLASEKDASVIDIQSEFGIGKARIERNVDNWPPAVTVRLHLRGLESFKVGQGDVTVEWFASMDGKRITSYSSLRQGNKESSLDKQSPYFTKVAVEWKEQPLPREVAYFEVRLPAKLFAGNPKEITLRWVDFFRD